ncbi:MAG: tyrosine-type recombinase/integrase [Oscillospiraceae bacterium]|jgi:integrase|nr:tyrosine-type recombinase/integrase [Oscillospiraceae bacterium]
MEKVPLKELVELLEQELLRVGYKESTLLYYRANWKRIVDHFESEEEKYFSEAVAMEYVNRKCDFFEKEKAGLLTQSNIYLFRIIRMLGDFQKHGVVSRRYMRSLSRVNEQIHLDILASFHLYCKTCDYAVSTQKSYQRITENFLSYLEARTHFVKDISTSDLTGYVNTLMGYSYKMVEFMLCGTRIFLRFLHTEKYLSNDLSESIPCIQTRRQIRIPSVWEHDSLLKLLDAIDRGNPSGKRDYAMILLVARLGLRSIDVKSLTFSCLKWEENHIALIQNKTHETVNLPLLKDVGWAIIDYLKNGRPKSDSPYIFLRHVAPIAPFSDDDRLHQVIVKYMRIAKLPISGKRKVGMHSLRHTLATSLLEQHVPIQEIADILGHQDTDSTAVYLKSSLKLLRECSLNPGLS